MSEYGRFHMNGKQFEAVSHHYEDDMLIVTCSRVYPHKLSVPRRYDVTALPDKVCEFYYENDPPLPEPPKDSKP